MITWDDISRESTLSSEKIIKVSTEEIYIIENKLNSIPNCYAFLKYLHLFNYKILC